jgi:hypothetical protein
MELAGPNAFVLRSDGRSPLRRTGFFRERRLGVTRIKALLTTDDTY